MNNTPELGPGSDEPRAISLRPAAFSAATVENSHTRSETEANRLTDYFAVLNRWKFALGGVTLLAVLGALAFSLLQAPAYRATASVEVQGLNNDFLNLKDVHATVPTNVNPTEATGAAEAESLKEDSLLERVVVALQLDRSKQFMPKRGILTSVMERLRFRSRSSAAPSDTAGAVAVLKENMVVETPRQGRILRIHYQWGDPVLAAEVANALAETLIQQKLEEREDATEQIAGWLDPQLTKLKRTLAQSEERLQKYAQSHGLLFTGGNENTGEQNLRLVQDELARARADRIAKQSIYQTVVPGAETSSEEDKVLQENQLKLTELKRQLAELSSVLKPENYKVERVQAQIAALEAAQQEERGQVRKRLQKGYEASQAREQLLAKDYLQQSEVVSNQSLKATGYESLKREVEVNRQVYEGMLQKAKEAGIASAIRPSNIRMVTAAKPPSSPYKPNLPLNLAVGLFVGVTFGVAYVMTAAQIDRKLRAPGQAELYLNVPELGAIPNAGLGVTRRLMGSNGHARGVELAAWDDRLSVFSESFRTTLASLMFNGGVNASPRVFVVTSPLAAEGKTTVASNLGVALAEIGRRVLLIDADLRGPQLHKVFSLDNDRGLSSLLADEDPLGGAILAKQIRQTSIPNLYVLTGGPSAEHVTSLLHAPRMTELLGRLRKEFDHVIVDAPPSLLFADARILARSTDGVVLVVRANRTSWPTAAATAQRLQRDGVPILGAVLNDWSPQAGTEAYRYTDIRKYYSAR